MAGRPRRRARLEAAERGKLPEFPTPPKPLAEMTAAERLAYTTQLRRALRDNEVRQGRRPPRSLREVEIWRAGREARDEQAASRIARAERRRPRQTGLSPDRAEEPIPVSEVTPEQIAQWMRDQLEQEGTLSQADAVAEIAQRFGEQFTYTNDNGNPAIDKRVLRAFKKTTGDTVVWERWDFCWRKRTDGDAAGRKQE